MEQPIQRVAFKSLVFTENFIGWVKYNCGGSDPHPVLDSLRQDFAQHRIATKLPFEFDYANAQYVVTLPTRPTLYLFVALKPNGQAKVIGGKFWTKRTLSKESFASTNVVTVTDEAKAEREKILRYLLKLSESVEYAEEHELLEASMRNIRELAHHTPEIEDGTE